MAQRKFKLRKGDEVVVIAGKDKGKTGKILEVLKEKERVLVDGVNKVKRHSRPTEENRQGGIIEKSMPLHISNVMLADPKSGKPTRIGKKYVESKGSGSWVRVAKSSGQELKA